MATSLGGGIGDVVSFKAKSDLSAKQYCGVKITAANQVGSDSIAETTQVVGVLQNKPSAAGVPADVQINGVTKVVTGGTCSAGDRLVCGTDARFINPLSAAVASTFFAVTALEAASTAQASGGGDIITAMITPTIGTTS